MLKKLIKLFTFANTVKETNNSFIEQPPAPIEYLNKWLVYSWSNYSSNRDNSLIHPDDLEKAEQNGLGWLLECIDEDADYLTLRSKDGELTRVKKEGVSRFLPSPPFWMGDWLQEVERPHIYGPVYDFLWHDKDAEYKYYILVNGKRKKRRYNPSELVLFHSDQHTNW